MEEEDARTLTHIGVSNPLTVEEAIDAIKNKQLMALELNRDEPAPLEFQMAKFIGYTQIKEDGLELGLFLCDMSAGTKKKFEEFVKALNS